MAVFEKNIDSYLPIEIEEDLKAKFLKNKENLIQKYIEKYSIIDGNNHSCISFAAKRRSRRSREAAPKILGATFRYWSHLIDFDIIWEQSSV